jgi:hypothetical protein
MTTSKEKPDKEKGDELLRRMLKTPPDPRKSDPAQRPGNLKNDNKKRKTKKPGK